MDLHSQIMNIPTIVGTYNDEFCYKLGHRDARHAAAELALKADARIEELKVYEKFATYLLNQFKLLGGTYYEDNLAYFRGIK
jgi:hypothetical protein